MVTDWTTLPAGDALDIFINERRGAKLECRPVQKPSPEELEFNRRILGPGYIPALAQWWLYHPDRQEWLQICDSVPFLNTVAEVWGFIFHEDIMPTYSRDFRAIVDAIEAGGHSWSLFYPDSGVPANSYGVIIDHRVSASNVDDPVLALCYAYLAHLSVRDNGDDKTN